MAFVIQINKHGTAGLCAVCDVCGAVCKKDEGNLLFHSDEVDWPGRQHVFYTACKEGCTQELDRRHGRLEWIDIDLAVFHLMSNTGIEISELSEIKRQAEDLAGP